MKLKMIISKVHLYLGLTIGLLFFLIAFSGAIYTWEPEYSEWAFKQQITPEKKTMVPLSLLKTNIDKVLPNADFRTALYQDDSHTMNVLIYAPGTYYFAFMNPYSGELVHLQDMNKGWIKFILNLHRNLLLGKPGQKIGHWVCLLFLMMVITGLTLWWPRNKGAMKQQFKIKWGASPKRLTYDLHHVLGFYATWVTIFSILTGLFWGFDFVKDGLKWATNEQHDAYEVPVSELRAPQQKAVNQFVLMDSLLEVYRKKYPDHKLNISNPHKQEDPIHIASIGPRNLVYSTEHFYFDRYTGKELIGHFENGKLEDVSTYHIIHGLVYDIHLGKILGLPGRILLCIASLIMASLPITGFLIWRGRRKKGKLNRTVTQTK